MGYPKFYFTRHGTVGDAGKPLSDAGKSELRKAAEMLRGLGFDPAVSISSPASRCLETAKLIAPCLVPIEAQTLVRFVNLQSLILLADEMFYGVLSFIPKDARGKDILIVSHDEASSVLAMRLIEYRGGRTDWRTFPRKMMLTDMGCGFFVDGTSFTYIDPNSISVS